MNQRRTSAQLEQLKAHIGRLEAAGGGQSTVRPRLLDADMLKVLPGFLSEIWTDRPLDAGAALGFAFGQARMLIRPGRQMVLWLQLTHEAEETGLPYGPGLGLLDLSPGQLVLGRIADVGALLWAVEEAAASPAVAAIIADITVRPKILDFTATRRFGLRAGMGETSIFLLRYGAEREASASAYRFHVRPALSAMAAFDARAPGMPRWHVRLEKGGQAGGVLAEVGQIVKWTGNGFTRADTDGASGTHIWSSPAVSGAQSTVLGNGLAEAG